MKCNNIWDKILDRTLRREECDNQNVYEFLTLLKKPGGYNRGSNTIVNISKDEWIRIVKKAKCKSVSSIFSKWNYSVYKCALESTKITKILVMFYNAVVKKGYYLKW